MSERDGAVIHENELDQENGQRRNYFDKGDSVI